MGKIMRTFDISFKKKAVDLYLKGDISYEAVANQLGIDKKQIRRWVNYFEAEGLQVLEEKRGKPTVLVRGDHERARRNQKKKLKGLKQKIKS
ncbi:helix-turn-helix domain-containing protein [Bacillus sp. T33-2]|uniref:helix-turn-helix domain-containing protein n=1 Tax=Bacillus sp. T33-2 TaxID=2054168 RepID=UPI0021555D61|nr:helix-turn-helix domain-containing protein [Bacillus sp. T33-2]